MKASHTVGGGGGGGSKENQRSRKCRYGARCHNTNCRFDHPKKEEGMNRGPCKYGSRCTRPNCWYEHPAAVTQTSYEVGSSHPDDDDEEDVEEEDDKPPDDHFSFCSFAELQERQKLGQVSILEATAETARRKQSQRRLDPSLAIARYRRSAAGSQAETPRSAATLHQVLQHLLHLLAKGRPTPQHPIAPLSVVVEFVIDRLRACQADATRLLDERLPPVFHLQLIRLLQWLYYWIPHCASENAVLWERTLQSLWLTAIEHYWASRSTLDSTADDEILAGTAMLRILQSDTEPISTLLLDYAQHVNLTGPLSQDYPLFDQALQLVSHLVRDEYHVLLRHSLPRLFQCCLAPHWLHYCRTQMAQHYHKAFQKNVPISDFDRLLHIQDWTPEYAKVLGLQDTVLEKGPLLQPSQYDKTILLQLAHSWVFGQDYNPQHPMGMAPDTILQLLQTN